MTNANPVLVTLLLVVLALVVGVGLVIALGPLKRSVVERFELRQRLALTPANAAHVVSALLITHRWRRVGLVVGLALGALWSIMDGSLTLNFFTGFLGWFAGAIIAEWRIGRLDQTGERRAASLAPRGIRLYVTTTNLVLLGVGAAAALALAVAALVRAGFSTEWLGFVGYALLVAAVLALTARAVVQRPSGFVDPDVREADDALRGHGLTVLVGSAIAASYPALWAFALQCAYPAGVPFSMDPAWTFLIFVACVLTGWFVAAGSTSARAARGVVMAPAADPSEPSPMDAGVA